MDWSAGSTVSVRDIMLIGTPKLSRIPQFHQSRVFRRGIPAKPYLIVYYGVFINSTLNIRFYFESYLNPRMSAASGSFDPTQGQAGCVAFARAEIGRACSDGCCRPSTTQVAWAGAGRQTPSRKAAPSGSLSPARRARDG